MNATSFRDKQMAILAKMIIKEKKKKKKKKKKKLNQIFIKY